MFVLRGRNCVSIVTNTYPNWKFKVPWVPLVFGKLKIHFTFNVILVRMVCIQFSLSICSYSIYREGCGRVWWGLGRVWFNVSWGRWERDRVSVASWQEGYWGGRGHLIIHQYTLWYCIVMYVTVYCKKSKTDIFLTWEFTKKRRPGKNKLLSNSS